MAQFQPEPGLHEAMFDKGETALDSPDPIGDQRPTFDHGGTPRLIFNGLVSRDAISQIDIFADPIYMGKQLLLGYFFVVDDVKKVGEGRLFVELEG